MRPPAHKVPYMSLRQFVITDVLGVHILLTQLRPDLRYLVVARGDGWSLKEEGDDDVCSGCTVVSVNELSYCSRPDDFVECDVSAVR